MNGTEDSFEGLGGVRLFAQHWRPEGPSRAVLAIVHGLGEHSDRYQKLVEHLVSRGHTVHGFDLRGHGRSPGQRGHVDTWADFREDLRAFLGHVARHEPGRTPFLLGHSLGTLIVLDYALRHPEGLRGVILSGTALEHAGVTSPSRMLVSRLLSRFWPRFPITTEFDQRTLSRIPEVVSAYAADVLVHNQTSARFWMEVMVTIGWLRAHVAEFQLPLLVVHGEADPLNLSAGARRVFEAARHPRKQLLLMPGGLHEPHNDVGQEQVFQAVEAFLGSE
ncbi:alpha/beta hydrolase [Hyalangium versicolor]|uniref:alpha/beta hydrolase n=1 Tax=Hyalangium versicolor TaxID=2861190 RepID=UPI001CCA29AC|nr:alpha/beta hydrolase [Hyalangium versicolor]